MKSLKCEIGSYIHTVTYSFYCLGHQKGLFTIQLLEKAALHEVLLGVLGVIRSIGPQVAEDIPVDLAAPVPTGIQSLHKRDAGTTNIVGLRKRAGVLEVGIVPHDPGAIVMR